MSRWDSKSDFTTTMSSPLHYLDDPDRKRPQWKTSGNGLIPAHNAVIEPPESGALLEYWNILKRRKWTLLLVAFLGIVTGVLISLPQTSMYQARASLEIQEFNENVLNKGFDSGNNNQNSDTETYFHTQIKLLQSESLLERVITKLNLHDNGAGNKNNRKTFQAVRSMLGLPEPVNIPEMDRLSQLMAENLSVRVSGRTRIVEILYVARDPVLAAKVVNVLANEFIDLCQEMRWRSTQRTGEWLTNQLAEMKVKLEKSEAELQAYAGASGLMANSGKDTIDETKLRQFQEELSKAQGDRVVRQSRFELANSTSAESLPEVLDDSTLRDYKIKLTELRRQRAELSATLTPAHYKVRQIDDQIAAVRDALERERSSILRRIQNEYETAQRREALLAEACAAQAKIVNEQSNRAIHYNMLKHEVDTTRQLYELLLQRVKEAGVASAMRAGNILIVDPAKPPLVPYKPNFFMNAAIGLLTGMFAGLGLVLFRERSDLTFRTPGETAMYLNVPELGVIPMHGSNLMSRLLRVGQHRNRLAAQPDILTVSPPKECLELAVRGEKWSPIAESFRAALPSILFRQDRTRPRVIVLTSAAPNEGKTTVVSNLALAIAEITGSVLLVDGDLRKPRLQTIFDANNRRGLSDILTNPGPLDPAQIDELIRPTSVPGVSFLPSGLVREHVSNAFYSRSLPQFLRIARGKFDTILIDAPPILQIPDARLLGRFADGVILVVRAGQTTRGMVLEAKQRLNEDGTLILGAILNSWRRKNVPKYGYTNQAYTNQG